MEPPLEAGRVEARRRGSRGYTKALVSVLLFAAALNLLLQGLGFVGPETLRPLGIGALCILAGAALWEIVERGARGPVPGAATWLAFPLAMILAAASLPFLAVAVYPPLREFILREGRVEARTSGSVIEIAKPKPVAPGPVNLRMDGFEVPPGQAERAPGAVRWSGPRLLGVDMERISAELPGAPRRPSAVFINAVRNVPRMRYETGDPVPRQRLLLEW